MTKKQKERWSIYGIIALLIILSPLVLIFLILAYFLHVLPTLLFVDLPIIRAMQTKQHHWLTWKDIKLISGKRTSAVVAFLMRYAKETDLLECRKRRDEDLVRLSRITGYSIPKSEFPAYGAKTVLFYEYRVIWRGGKSFRSSNFLRLLLPYKLEPA